jgi:hypothetical protein
LSKQGSIGIASNTEDPTDKKLYLVVFPDQRPMAFPIAKAGQYYYLNTKVLFDTLKIDYSLGNVVFDIKPDHVDDMTVYVLHRREPKKKKETEEELF